MEKIDSEEKSSEKRLYEVGYLLLPILSDEDVQKEFENIKNIIAKEGGEIVLEGTPKKMRLEYEMSKIISNKKSVFSDGYFGWVKTKINAGSISNVKDVLSTQQNILRFIIISTVIYQEPQRKIYKPKTPVKVKKDTPIESKPIDEKALDREIEELLVE